MWFILCVGILTYIYFSLDHDLLFHHVRDYFWDLKKSYVEIMPLWTTETSVLDFQRVE